MKRLWLSVLSVFILAAILSGYFYFNLSRIVPESKNQLKETMDFLNSDTINYDIVFIGSSRVYVHIDPRVIDSACQVNSVCVAMDGSTITQQLALLQKYLEKHPAPKLVMLGLDYSSLQASLLPYNYPDYYAYLNDSAFATINSRAISRFQNRKFFEKYDAFMKYSAKTDYQKFASLSSTLMLPKKYDNLSDEPSWFSALVTYKGFCGLEKGWSAEAEKQLALNEKVTYEKQGLDFLNEFVELSKQHSSKVVIVFSPMFNNEKKQFEGSAKYFEKVKEVTTRQEVPLWDYRNDSLCFDKKFFYNTGHLNKLGAEIFSLKLAKDLNQYIAL